MRRIYLDYSATTPLDPQVKAAMEPYLGPYFGNPSSLHQFGREAREGLDWARDRMAELLGCLPKELLFTSSGTEADNTALFGVAYQYREKGNHIISTAMEHHAILEPLKVLQEQGYQITLVYPDRTGIVDPEAVLKAITRQTILVSVMTANNEIGTLQPIQEIGEGCRQKGVLFHTDAVQAVGMIPINLQKLPVDLLSLSAHKFYGPKGVGALFIRSGVKIKPLLWGGTQERERRAGTENVAGIVGMAKALELALQRQEEEHQRLQTLRDRMIQSILKNIEGSWLNGHPSLRLPNNVNVGFKEVSAETLLMNLDLEGIACSSGSACSSGALEPSHVLLAIGLSEEEANSSIRITLGRYTTSQEIEETLKILAEVVQRIRRVVAA